MTTVKFKFAEIHIHRLGADYWADGIHVLAAIYGSVDERQIQWAEDMLPSAMKTYLTIGESGFYEKRLMISLWGVMTLAIKSSASNAREFADVWRHYMEDTLSAKQGQRDLMHEVMNIKRRLDGLDAVLSAKAPEREVLEADIAPQVAEVPQAPVKGQNALSDWLKRRKTG